MTQQEISTLLEKQRSYFATGATLPVRFRREMLGKLYAAVKKRQDEIAGALQKDLGKSEYESFMCEIGLTLSEITYMRRHVGALARKRRVHTPLAQLAAVSYTQPSPYGNTLIMSPWNYPFLLTIEPLADAIAAGNTAIVKPSAYSPATSAVIAGLLSEIFPEEYVAVVTGGRQENACLLEQKFDMVFFTGSQAVGREVLRHTAETLTPAVLELGGKSPCIVDGTAKIDLAARRIVFGKFLNCGQTCVAPDYILCDRTVKDALVEALQKEVRRQFGENPLENPNYGKIITQKHYDRLMGLIAPDKVVLGGTGDPAALRIAPTLLDRVDWEDAVMQEEIFGPVLPILTYDRFEEVIPLVNSRAKPLALYIFSEDRARISAVTAQCSFGGGCVNDVVIHLATSEMAFGGVGESGMGGYHGKAGFEAFSHRKSIVDKKTWMDLPMRYQPYRRLYRRLLTVFLR
ncbi:MAG: aldehyde dehydrogenase [Aristaeellaceae bacterium]